MQTAIVVLLSKLRVFSKINFTQWFTLRARHAFVWLVLSCRYGVMTITVEVTGEWRLELVELIIVVTP